MDPAFRSDLFKSVKPELPERKTPQWETTDLLNVINRDTLLKIFEGKAPIGKIPYQILSETQRKQILSELCLIAKKKYEDTSDEQKISVWGTPFVDQKTLADYLSAQRDPRFDKITEPVLNMILTLFRSWGFTVIPFIDPETLQTYLSVVGRSISVPEGCRTKEGNKCSLLHCDDISRDGLMKPDFRLPIGLAGKKYYQVSLNILLDDGGYPPDKVYIFEKQYSRELECNFLSNKWQYPVEAVEDCRSVSFRPLVGDCYIFSTLNFHDVKDGHSLSNRITLGIFFVYVPETNEIFFYN